MRVSAVGPGQRAVEVLCFYRGGKNAAGRWTVGSGYLAGGGLVITAAHNVGSADAEVSVRLNRTEVPATVLASGGALAAGGARGPDLSVLELQGNGFPGLGDLPPVSFGRIDRDRIDFIEDCWAVGFPWYKERRHEGLPAPRRLAEQVRGVIPPAANLGEMLLSLRVDAAPRPLPGGPVAESEWQGMSGAVVFAPGARPGTHLAVGVVSEHHLPEGPSSLTVVPLTSLAELGTASPWWRRLSLGEVDEWPFAAPPPGSAPPGSRPSQRDNVNLDFPASDFTDREAEMERVSALLTSGLGDSHPVVVIHGMGGVGKSELANQAAHRLGRIFHHARVQVDLGGGGLAEATAEAAFAQILDGFGLSGEEVPRDPGKRRRLVRDLLGGGPCLLVLDNAESAAQVKPLLLGGAGSATVITSRGQLRGLRGAASLFLEPLPGDEGVLLLERVRGEQPEPFDREAASRIVALVGGLPLAVRIAGGAAASPAMRRKPLSHLAGLLEDEDRRLSRLDDEDHAVRSAFDVSYRNLPSATARFFRCLGLLTAADFRPELAAYVAELTVDEAERLLEELTDRQLVNAADGTAARYRLHELVRLYSRERAHEEEPPDEWGAALRRSLEWYASCVDELMAPPGSQEHPSDEALAWFGEEQLNLLSSLRTARDTQAWDLLVRMGEKVYGLFWYRGLWEELADVKEWAAEAAARSGDAYAELGSLIHRAEALRILGRAAQTPPMYDRAVELARELGDEDKEGWVLTHYGDLQCDLGHPEEALRDYYARALTIYRKRGDEGAEIWLSAHISDACLQLGRPEAAVEVEQRALTVSRERGDAAEIAWSQWHLALALSDAGRFAAAEQALADAIAYHRSTRNRSGLATMLLFLGRIRLAAGQPERAREVLTEALASAQSVGVPHLETDIRTELSRTGL